MAFYFQLRTASYTENEKLSTVPIASHKKATALRPLLI